MKEPAHLALHPFGQIPTYEEGDLALFETGAIVFHIAEHHAGLLPEDANARARAITWMFAALNTVEPPIFEFATARLLEGDKPWSEERLPLVEGRVRPRLEQLSTRLGDADWLDGAFSAGDLLMVSVLLRLKSSGILDEYPNLAAYVARGEARPAYKRAFAAQLAINTAKPPTAIEIRRGLEVVIRVFVQFMGPDPRLPALRRRRERREVGGASGQSYLGARLGLSFKGLTVAGTPNFSTLPDGALQRVAYP